MRVTDLGNDDFEIEKIPFDPQLKTNAANTIKFSRAGRCKNEKLHGALKQKDQFLDSRIELTYLEPLFPADSPHKVSKYGALAAIIASNYNFEHAGFPVKFLREEQKIPKAIQILKNFNTENFLQHIDVGTSGWSKIDYEDFHTRFGNFPQTTPATFSQLFEVTSSIHSLTKGEKVSSHLRKTEVDGYDDVRDFDDLEDLLSDPPLEIQVKYKRLVRPSAEYLNLEAAGILPPWPGPGTLFRVTCLPSNRSDTNPQNSKHPTIFILDDSTLNPLHCSDVFKSVGAMNCYNCPSLNGGISTCAHLGFELLLLSSPYALFSVNRPVKLVNMKNRHGFLNPAEVLENIQTLGLPINPVPHQREDKRKTDILYNPEENIVSESEDEQSDPPQSSSAQHPDQAGAQEEENNGQEINSEINNDNLADLNQDFPEGNEQPETRSGCGGSQYSGASLYGQSVANVENYLQRMTRRNPSRMIPPRTTVQGKQSHYSLDQRFLLTYLK